MKNLITIILIVSTTFVLKAQKQFSDGNYHQQPTLNKFEGKWTYVNDTLSFTINLRKEKVHVKRGNDDFYIDLIQGDYVLLKKGKVIDSSDEKKATINGGSFADGNKDLNKIKFIFFDLGKGSKRCQASLELIDDLPSKAKWTLTNTEHIVVGSEKFDPTFSIPRNLVLIKEK